MEYIKTIILVWRNCSLSGILNNPIYPYNKQNLDYAIIIFFVFLTNKFKNIVIKQIGPLSGGLQVLTEIVKNRLLKLLTRQRDLIHKLSTLNLQDKNGEDVRKLNFKISDLCKEIEQTGKHQEILFC